MNFQDSCVIGIDPGLQKTGWAVVTLDAKASFSCKQGGIIKTSTKDELHIRLLEIFNSISGVIEKLDPQYAAIEETYVNKNFSSSLKLAHARAAAMLAASTNNLKVFQYSATKIKKTITGSGNADKEQIRKLTFLRSKIKLEHVNQDIIDAIAIGICHLLHI
ncbi:MAG: crossover junction endodeoxyribonuclease RuvC [Proteobacteria bacterium]|nr:crossover junction endodeoxyribonuclease RuvC [Pseudomonadota bacterium]